jgi:uncharacterized membrane protein (DUF441 family)
MAMSAIAARGHLGFALGPGPEYAASPTLSRSPAVSFLSTHATSFLLLLFMALGIIGRNSSVTIAAAVLLLVQQSPLKQYAPLLERHGLQLGIVILTVGVMAPLITGKIKAEEIVFLLGNWKTGVAIVVGVFVAGLGGRGVQLMTADPTVVTGLLVGTILGGAFFRGVPVGPLIAAGMLAVILRK